MDNDLLQTWLSSATDETTHRAIENLKISDPPALEAAFTGRLAFGTGGVRALMGVGPARLNRYTIRQITQGLAKVIIETAPAPHALVIGHDCRHNSIEFAEEVAKVCAGNGIRAYLLEELRPTPFISFLIRHLKASGGVNITASHNPKAYNGYKVYGADGAQVTAPLDGAIMESVEGVRDFESVKLAPSDSELIHRLGADEDLAYLEACDALALRAKENHAEGSALKIVYSPLHGTGITLLPRLLNRWGFSDLALVESQMTPDGDFTNAPSPNPEDPKALEAGLDLMEKLGADLFIATDPDADRLAVSTKTQLGPLSLNGNELACILLEHIATELGRAGKLPKNGAVIKSIVTTELLGKIAAAHGLTCIDVLTGFKYIGEMIHTWEKSPNSPTFIFGAEESYGSLYGTLARDKDAISTAGLAAEVALVAKSRGKGLGHLLDEIYAKYGLFRQCLHTLPLDKPVKEVLDELRAERLGEIAGHRVVACLDYEKGTCRENGQETPLSLPKSGVLLYTLENEGKLVIRGSGTEPKIKIYAELRGEDTASTDEKLKTLVEAFLSEIN